MIWLLLAACSQSQQCDKADDYLRWVDGDGTIAAQRDLEGTGYETSDCGTADPDVEPSAEFKAACGKFWEASDTFDTCSDECTRVETDAYKTCHDDCEAGDYDSETWSTDMQLCSQACPDQPEWDCS